MAHRASPGPSAHNADPYVHLGERLALRIDSVLGTLGALHDCIFRRVSSKSAISRRRSSMRSLQAFTTHSSHIQSPSSMGGSVGSGDRRLNPVLSHIAHFIGDSPAAG